MKKVLVSIFMIAAMAAFPTGCGNIGRQQANVGEPEKQEDARESQEGEVSETDDGWKEYYRNIAGDWEKAHEEDSIHGYKLLYLNDDDIPELVLIGCPEWTCLEIYTYPHGEASKVYSAQNLGVDGNGLSFYEKTGFLVAGKWNAGIGEYVFFKPMSEDPDKVYCRVDIATEGGLSQAGSTDVEYIGPEGEEHTAHYDEEYDLPDLLEKSSIEEALGIADLSALKRLDSEDDLIDFTALTDLLDRNGI